MPELDLGNFLANDTLVLKGIPSEKHPGGHAYRVPSPSAKFGLLLQKMMSVWSEGVTHTPTDDDIKDLLQLVTTDEGDVIDFAQRLLGDAYQQMLDDGVSAERMEMIRTVVMAHYAQGAVVARQIVEQSGEAAARANRATRRAAKKTAGSKSRRASTATTGSGQGRTSPTSPSSTSANGPEAATAV